MTYTSYRLLISMNLKHVYVLKRRKVQLSLKRLKEMRKQDLSGRLRTVRNATI